MERIASPCGCPPNIPLNIRAATVKSGARKKTHAMQTAEISGEPAEKPSREIVQPTLCARIKSANALDHQIGTMKQTPNNKRPGRAVPEAAEKHDDDQIYPGAHGPDLIAAYRNVKVVAQESGKRDCQRRQKSENPIAA